MSPTCSTCGSASLYPGGTCRSCAARAASAATPAEVRSARARRRALLVPFARIQESCWKANAASWSGEARQRHVDAAPRGEDHALWVGDEAGYRAVHKRVEAARGRARHEVCVDGCGRWADDWSYIGGDPDEKVQTTGPYAGSIYSTNPDYYEPRCRGDHQRYDREHGLTRATT